MGNCQPTVSPANLTKTILDGNTPTQLHIDFRTQRPTAIDFFSPTADQRAACTALNRERTRAILEADQLASSGEPLSADVWEANVARKSRERDVPLIPLSCLGIHHDEDGMLGSDFLSPLLSGAEACPFFDEEWKVVYKLFDLRVDGSLGKKIVLEEPESERFEIQLLPARLVDTLEKLSVLNEAGGHPTEIVGLSSNGDFLIAKQPLAFPYKDYQKDREIATKAVGGIVPLFNELGAAGRGGLAELAGLAHWRFTPPEHHAGSRRESDDHRRIDRPGYNCGSAQTRMAAKCDGRRGRRAAWPRAEEADAVRG
jgi:hypothetical protein